jgi:DNA-binding GntR family transcriptional regulator
MSHLIRFAEFHSVRSCEPAGDDSESGPELIEARQRGMKLDTSLRNQAYDKLRAHLVFGELPAGSEISEPRLSKMLGIGRTPVREAVQQLEAEGLLERTPRRGTVVRMPMRKDILDLFEVREGMESYAAFLAANRISKSDLSQLQKLCDQLELLAKQLEKTGKTILQGTALRQFVGADMGFHMLLISATGNQRLVKLISDSHVLGRIFNTIGTVGREQTLEVVKATRRMHGDVLEALKRGDAVRARQVMSDHIRLSCQETLENFDAGQQQHLGTSTGLEHLHVPFEMLVEFERIGLSQGDRPSPRAAAKRNGNTPKATATRKTRSVKSKKRAE